MARIKITDLPKDMEITKEELKRVRGGARRSYLPSPSVDSTYETDRSGESPLDRLALKI